MSAVVQSLLVGALSVIISLIITFIFNGIVNLPKKKKQKLLEEEAKDKKTQETINNLIDKIEELNTKSQEIKEKIEKRELDSEKLAGDLKLIKLGLQAVIKNELKIRYEYWIQETYAPIDAKEDLERMYQIYHKLGANGVMDSLRERFMNLPNEINKGDNVNE